MHLLLHVIGAQADSSYTAYFPIGVFFVVLGFMLFFFIQRVLGPLLTPAGAAPGGSCCAVAVPSQVSRPLRTAAETCRRLLSSSMAVLCWLWTLRGTPPSAQPVICAENAVQCTQSWDWDPGAQVLLCRPSVRRRAWRWAGRMARAAPATSRPPAARRPRSASGCPSSPPRCCCSPCASTASLRASRSASRYEGAPLFFVKGSLPLAQTTAVCSQTLC